MADDAQGGFLAVSDEGDLIGRLQADIQALDGGSSSVAALLAIGTDGSTATEARWRALINLGKLGAGEAVPALLDALRDPSWEVRHSAYWSLCQIGDARAFEALRDLCTTGPLDEQNNFIAAVGLARRYGEAGRAVLRDSLASGSGPAQTWARAALAAVEYL